MSTEIMSADEMVREALREVIDPEIGVNIVDLGMVYEVEVEGESVKITMTLTTPACPLSEYIDAAVKEALEPVPGITDVDVNLVWTPPWTPAMMSEDAKLELGFW
jgi:metal-sulfur cluster biosynthetic enzyme